jgi:hypothetical protein
MREREREREGGKGDDALTGRCYGMKTYVSAACIFANQRDAAHFHLTVGRPFEETTGVGGGGHSFLETYLPSVNIFVVCLHLSYSAL